LVYGEKAVFVNVDEDPEKLKEMLILSGGKMQVSVIVEGEKVKIGFSGHASIPQGLGLLGGT
jgi:glutaredoxin 3